MNSRLAVAVSTAVIVLLAAGFLTTVQQGANTTGSMTGTGSQYSTTIGTGGSYVNAPQNLQLRLSVDASSSAPTTFRITADEYNTLATANNVTVGRAWPVTGLSLGSCGTQAYPFGVALYRGSYTAENASKAQPLRIYPALACPMMIRYITGYLFQPSSDFAVVLPSGPNATATRMSANVTATGEYSGVYGAASSSTPLGPGTYTVAAGDEWGSLVLVHVTVGTGTTTSSNTGAGSTGTLQANFDIGPTAPVCRANMTIQSAPSLYSSIGAVVTPQPSGQALTLPILWLSNGCSVTGTLNTSLAPGTYTLNLTSCQWMGCSSPGSALPKTFVVIAGQTTTINVSIDTGIR
ncbi:MAG TPA: hypothetical protein VEO75_06130 [Nitrososphaerales archaeon]|nr:hypothetical protein [Nitrososphaerales archaeon]